MYMKEKELNKKIIYNNHKRLIIQMIYILFCIIIGAFYNYSSYQNV
jgi:hypothetical protein